MAFPVSKYPLFFHQISHYFGRHDIRHFTISTHEKILLPSSSCYKFTIYNKKETKAIPFEEKILIPFTTPSDCKTNINLNNGLPRQETPLLTTSRKDLTTNSILKRLLHNAQRHKKRPVPRIYYVQNPLYWLDNKISFRYLRKLWDPEFNEKGFKEGANQAVSTVTKLIASDNYDDLVGLVSDTEARYLRRVFASKEYIRQIRHVGIDTDDIQVCLPRKVSLTKHFEQKFCDIDMVYVAEKWTGLSETDKLALIVMLVRFHREFTEGVLPVWIITLFRITKLKFYPTDNKRN